MPVTVENVSGQVFTGLISPAICETLSCSDLMAMEHAMIKSVDVRLIRNGEMLGIAGVSPDTLLSSEAYIWLYANPFNERVPITALRSSRRIVSDFLSVYPRLVGHCESTNTKAQRWLRWLGARFAPSATTLIPFMIEAKK